LFFSIFLETQEENKPVFKIGDLNCSVIWNEWLLAKLENYVGFIKEKNLI